jgi:hypothetical protein
MSVQALGVTSLEVAIVSADPAVRLAAARAFDEAPASWAVSIHESQPEGADVVVLGPDAPGDGIRFDPSKPERMIEDINRAAAPACRTVLVTGAGRGVGCTTLALHLALEMARKRETCFVDLDPDSLTAERLGIDEKHLTWANVGSSDDSLRLAALPVPGGFRVLLSSPEPTPPSGLLARVQGSFERVVVDCPWEVVSDDVLSSVDAGVLVMTATTLGAKRVARTIEDDHDLDWVVVANRLGPGGEATRAALSRAAGRRVALDLPCTPALRNAEQAGRLIATPWSRWKLSVARLAAALENA